MWKTTPLAASVAGNKAIALRTMNTLFGLLLIVCLSPYQLSAQRNLTLYNLNAVPQSLSLNPGRLPLSNGYVGIPVVGSIYGSYSNSSFTFGDLMLGGDEDFFDNSFDDFLGTLDGENRLITDINNSWLDFGFRVKQNFISFSIGEHVTFQADYPRSIFELFDDVANENLSVGETRSYALGTLGFNGSHYRSYGIGFARAITPKLSGGIKLKFLTGLSNVSSFNYNLTFVNDFDNEFLGVSGRLDIFSAGLQMLSDDPANYLRGNGNNGFAVDFGGVYNLNDQIELFFSALNIGRIHWKNDLTHNAFVANNVNLSTDNIDEFEEELMEFIDSLQTPAMTPAGTYKTGLPALVYLGGNYYFQPNTSVGAMLNPRFFEGNIDLAFMLSLQHRFGRWFQLLVNYSAYNKNAFNLGVGSALNLGPLQIYLATDNITPVFNIDNAKNIQFNAGINLSFGRKTRAEQLAEMRGENLDSLAVPQEDIVLNDQPQEQPMQKEEPVRQSKKERKQVEPTTNQPTPSTPAPEPVSTELKPYVTLLGTARHVNSGEKLAGVMVDVYRIKPDGSEEIAMFKGFLNGDIQLSLKRGETYRVVVKKGGFADRSEQIMPVDMEGMNQLEKDFVLQTGTTQSATIDQKQETESEPQATSDKEQVASSEERSASDQPQETSRQEPATFKPGNFRVLVDATLQREPSESSKVLIRFSPGEQVRVLERVNDTWFKAKYLGVEGYVRAAVVERID